MKRFSYLVAIGLLLLSSVPAFAQANGNGNGNNDNNGSNFGRGGCAQTTTGGGDATIGGTQSNRAGSTALLAGVIDAAVQDVQALNNIDAALSALNGSNLQIVCLNDTLNQNDVRILRDVLNGSPILSGDLNHSLNNNTVLNSLLQGVMWRSSTMCKLLRSTWIPARCSCSSRPNRVMKNRSEDGLGGR